MAVSRAATIRHAKRPLHQRSGRDQHARHKALGKILDVGNYHLEKGYVLGATNVSQKSNFLNKNDPTSAMKTIQLPQSPR